MFGGGLKGMHKPASQSRERSYVSLRRDLTSGIKAFVEIMHDFEHVSKTRARSEERRVGKEC